jgi:uncharacterized membrane protein YgdD (TMEM256/DUF423 family)
MALEHTRGRDAGARFWFACGALMGLLAVAAAALAAHLPDRMLASGGRESLRSAVQIIGWHAAALLAAGIWLGQGDFGRGWRPRLIHLAATCFVIGTICFCAGVAVPAFGGPHLGRVAPTGGSLLMIGWALLAASAVPRRSD